MRASKRRNDEKRGRTSQEQRAKEERREWKREREKVKERERDKEQRERDCASMCGDGLNLLFAQARAQHAIITRIGNTMHC